MVDVDGNEFIEYGSGLRAVNLGHAHPEVIAAVRGELEHGCNFVRPSPREVELAELMLQTIPGMEMVKFGKHGSDATSAAVRLSRAFTGRDLIAVCADHPFFSVDDWFIGSSPMPAGIPEAVRGLTVKFRYNDLSSVQELFDRHPGRIACVMMEAEKETPPGPGYLQSVQELCHRHGAVFVLDEIITGFRWHVRGAQHVYGVKPDLCAFGKGIANGFSVSALMGRRDIMSLGGIDPGRDRVFLLSTTHGGETHELAAALATVKICLREDVTGAMHRMGARLRAGLESAARRAGVFEQIPILGRDCNLVFGTRDSLGKPSQAFRALFMQECIRRGVLAPSLVVNYAHREEDIDQTIERMGEAMEVYRKALEDGVEGRLAGEPTRPVFRPR